MSSLKSSSQLFVKDSIILFLTRFPVSPQTKEAALPPQPPPCSGGKGEKGDKSSIKDFKIFANQIVKFIHIVKILHFQVALLPQRGGERNWSPTKGDLQWGRVGFKAGRRGGGASDYGPQCVTDLGKQDAHF